jgi:GT2 family glycosyltransferase
MNPEVAVITINFRGASDTIECIESLLEQDHPSFRIFVIDNASGDDSVESIERWGGKLGDAFISIPPEKAELVSHAARVVLIRAPENLGFAGGNNLGMKVAKNWEPKYFWLVNNDTVQDKSALSALAEVAGADEGAGMVCSKVLYHQRPDTIESLGSRLIIPLGVFRHIMQGKKDSDAPASPSEVPFIYGCSFLVKAELVRQVGPMEEKYFLLREESDWCLRARRLGWRAYCAPGSRVWHKVTSTMGKRSNIFFYYVTRNTLLFMKEHYPIFLITSSIAMVPLVTGLVLVDSLFSGRGALLRRLWMAALGYLHFFQGRFGRLN